MANMLRIGNAHGFWGDRLDAASEMLEHEPDLDFLTFDFLAEVSMSILARQRERDPAAGYCRDFVDIIRSLAPYWSRGGRCRLISNAGGLNPRQCAVACQQVLQEANCGWIRVAVVSGDDVLQTLQADSQAELNETQSRNLDTGEPIRTVISRLTTANAYLGARPVAEALRQGADLVITGRIADPSLTVAPCAEHFEWDWNDWDRLAGATVAGHLIECGTQVTGGISTDWYRLPGAERIGFPIVEVNRDGSCVVTKSPASGGLVTESTVKEQLLYEISDPGEYISPDVTVSFLSLDVQSEGPQRIRIRGALGRGAPATLKVSATYQDGYRAAGQLTVFGEHAVAKARRAARIVLDQLARRGITLRHAHVDCIGTGACRPDRAALVSDDAIETVLRISVGDPSRESVEQFSRQLMPLVTAGPPGTTCYADGRPRVHPQFAFWPCLIASERVTPQVELLDATARRQGASAPPAARATGTAVSDAGAAKRELQDRVPRVLGDLALARSGDKGRHANIGVIARQSAEYDLLLSILTSDRVAKFLGVAESAVVRYELPNLNALNFVVHDILDPLRVDAQGKALGQYLLQMPLPRSGRRT